MLHSSSLRLAAVAVVALAAARAAGDTVSVGTPPANLAGLVEAAVRSITDQYNTSLSVGLTGPGNPLPCNPHGGPPAPPCAGSGCVLLQSVTTTGMISR